MNRNPASVLRSLLFSLGYVAITGIWGTISLLTVVLPYPKRYRFITTWAQLVLWWLRLTCAIDCRVSGLENIPSTPVIVLAKHQSTWETLYLTQLFRPQVWVLKRELLWVPVFGWALALLRPIAIDRSSVRAALKQVLRQGKARLDEGTHVVIFPEGTRVTPGTRGRYGIGGPLLAHHTKVPVLPIAHNAGEFWPRGVFLKHPGTIQVVIGPVIETSDKPVELIRDLASEWIETQMISLTSDRECSGLAGGARSERAQ